MYCINGKVSQNQFTFQLFIYINYFSKTSFYFKMAAVNVLLFKTLAYISKCRGKQLLKSQSLMLMLILLTLLYILYKQNNKN